MHPAPIDLLRMAYADLAERPSTRLTADQRRSLIFFNFEMALIENRDTAASVPARVIQWTSTLHQLQAFVASNGRWPRENNRAEGSTISPIERRLATWVRTQRSAADLGRRCDYQLRRLSCVDGYHARPLDDRWNDQYVEYQRFTLTNNRAPLLSSTDRAEKKLAAWAAKQRLRHRRGRLPVDRVSTLETMYIWGWGSATTR